MTESDWSLSVKTTPQVFPTFDSDTPISFEYNSGTYQQGAAVTIGGITQPIQGRLPPKGQPFILELTRDGEGFDLTFTIDTVGRDGKNKTNVTGYGYERKLHQTSLTRSYESMPAGEVIRAAADAAGVPHLNAAFPDADSVEDPDARRILLQQQADETSQVTTDYQQVPAIAIIEEVCRSQSWEWRITSSGGGGSYLWYGEQAAAAGVPRNQVPDIQQGSEGVERALAINTAPKTHQLQWVKPEDTDPRAQEYPFDIVRVAGPPATKIEGGLQYTHRPIIAEIDIGPNGESGASEGATPRLHLFQSERIGSQGQANRLCRLLWKELERQSFTGVYSVVGFPDVEPLDRVVVPDWAGGGNYLVNSVLHTIDESEGFVSSISVGGQPDLSTMPGVRTEPTFDGQIVSRASESDDDQANGDTQPDQGGN